MKHADSIEGYRNALDLSQEDVASRVSISRQYYNSIENGKRKPSVDLAKKLASVLQTDWTIFFKE